MADISEQFDAAKDAACMAMHAAAEAAYRAREEWEAHVSAAAVLRYPEEHRMAWAMREAGFAFDLRDGRHWLLDPFEWGLSNPGVWSEVTLPDEWQRDRDYNAHRYQYVVRTPRARGYEATCDDMARLERLSPRVVELVQGELARNPELRARLRLPARGVEVPA